MTTATGLIDRRIMLQEYRVIRTALFEAIESRKKKIQLIRFEQRKYETLPESQRAHDEMCIKNLENDLMWLYSAVNAMQ